MRSSRAAVDLIVAHEVTSRAVYEKKYQRPIWPGVASGLTVGIGYDLGYNTKDDIARDWAGKLPPAVIRAMQKYAGLTKANAQAQLSQARKEISVSWEAAMAVFMEVSLPKFEAKALRACPGSDKLPAGCFGVLASLTYNRGPSFTKPRTTNDHNDRYREMRAIRTHIMNDDYSLVPSEIRSMKRLWNIRTTPGLHRRRDEEADLWEKSLAAANIVPLVSESAPAEFEDTGDELSDDEIDAEVESYDELNKGVPLPDDNINVQPISTEYSFEVELIERELIGLKYFEVGDPKGHYGGKTVAAISAFMTDRGKDPNRGQITQELKDELEKAKKERDKDGNLWSRPIAKSRACATATELQNKVPGLKATWWNKFSAWILGVPAALTAGFQSLFGEDTFGGYIYQIKSFFSAIPTELYALGVVGLAVAIFFAARHTEKSAVKAYNEGKIN